MKRSSERATEGRELLQAERERHCLRCGHPARDLPRGCKASHCQNCGYRYPLGDCSD